MPETRLGISMNLYIQRFIPGSRVIGLCCTHRNRVVIALHAPGNLSNAVSM
jgi:hypothetical protein